MAPSPSNSVLPDHLMNKNRLQEYTQKSGKGLPIYETFNEGFPHAPRFRSSVLVDGKKYTSNLTFVHRKEAEQEVARLAFECITENTKDEGCPLTLIHQDLLGCKLILHEFAFKNKISIPKYKTTCEEGKGVVFVSSLDLGGKTYTGDVAGSKKLAEQLAARTAIESLLRSNLGTELSQIIKAKAKLLSSSNTVQKSSCPNRILSIATKREYSPPQLTKFRSSNIASRSSSGRTMDYSSGGKCGLGIQYYREPKKMRRDEE